VDQWVCLDLFWRFMLVSLVAFGGSQSALSLVERMAVRETGWVSTEEFAAALGSSYVSPGPIGMMAAFIGYRVGGFLGTIAAMLGMFLVPWLIAAGAARMLQPLLESRWLRGFGRVAGAAVVGLQAVIAFDLARQAFTSGVFVAVALIALVVSLLTSVHPLLILLGGVLVGLAVG
jgi:chromate transporter